MVEQLEMQGCAGVVEMAKEIRPWLEKIDRVKNALDKEGDHRQIKFNLPIIVVIGDQSSGKSSVLESIVQFQLPKGQGMVTRCPLVIQLRNAANDEEEHAKIWAGTENQEDAAETVSLSGIGAVIDAKQKSMTSEAQKISKVPIYLRIIKKNFFDLTLVDLPGLTYIDGLAPQIEALYTEYITNPNSLILYVTSATTDLVTG